MIEATFNVKITCLVDKEEEIEKLKKELEDLSLGAAGVVYYIKYNIDSVERS